MAPFAPDGLQASLAEQAARCAAGRASTGAQSRLPVAANPLSPTRQAGRGGPPATGSNRLSHRAQAGVGRAPSTSWRGAAGLPSLRRPLDHPRPSARRGAGKRGRSSRCRSLSRRIERQDRRDDGCAGPARGHHAHPRAGAGQGGGRGCGPLLRRRAKGLRRVAAARAQDVGTDHGTGESVAGSQGAAGGGPPRRIGGGGWLRRARKAPGRIAGRAQGAAGSQDAAGGGPRAPSAAARGRAPLQPAQALQAGRSTPRQGAAERSPRPASSVVEAAAQRVRLHPYGCERMAGPRRRGRDKPSGSRPLQPAFRASSARTRAASARHQSRAPRRRRRGVSAPAGAFSI